MYHIGISNQPYLSGRVNGEICADLWAGAKAM